MVRRPQRLLGVDLHPAPEVDEREEDVAELVEHLLVGRGGPQLLELLLHLLPHARDRVPVPAQGRCALLDLAAARQGRQRAGDPAEGVGALLAPLGALVGLDGLPVAEHLVDPIGGDVAEHVRVASHDLSRDGPIDIGQVEFPLLGGELRVEDHLQEEVAQLLGEVGGRAVLDRVDRLVGLLEQVRAQREMGLLPIPRAAVGGAQPSADRRHAVRAREVVDRPQRRHEPVVGGKGRVVEGLEGDDRIIGEPPKPVRRRVERGEHRARPAPRMAPRQRGVGVRAPAQHEQRE